MANAPTGARVGIQPRRSGGGGLTLEMELPGGESSGYTARTFRRLPDGRLEVHNDIFMLPAGSPYKGHGLSLFLNQVRSLRAAGVDLITTAAAGDFDRSFEGAAWNGYITWPKFG